MISGEEFAAGAQQLAAHWARCLPGEPPWRWQPSRQPFAAAAVSCAAREALKMMLTADFQQQNETTNTGYIRCVQGGGYLELQRVQQAAPNPGGSTPAVGDSNLELLASDSEGAEEADAADARQCTPAGVAAGCLGASGASTEAPAQAPPVPPEQRLLLMLTCHIAYHLSYRVPVLYFEVKQPAAAAAAFAADFVPAVGCLLPPACCRASPPMACHAPSSFLASPPLAPALPCRPPQVAGRNGAPLGLGAALAALPQLRGATAGTRPDTVVTQEVMTRRQLAWAAIAALVPLGLPRN